MLYEQERVAIVFKNLFQSAREKIQSRKKIKLSTVNQK